MPESQYGVALGRYPNSDVVHLDHGAVIATVIFERADSYSTSKILGFLKRTQPEYVWSWATCQGLAVPFTPPPPPVEFKIVNECV